MAPIANSQIGQFYQHLRSLKPGQDLLLVEALVPALQQLEAAPSRAVPPDSQEPSASPVAGCC